MLNFLALALENDLIYIGIIVVLVVIIILTIISIRKDSKKIKNKKVNVETVHNVEEQQHAKLELEKVVSEMQKSLDAKNGQTSTAYDDDEEDAIISYQELVKAVKDDKSMPHKEVGMEIADTKSVEEINRMDEEPLDIYEEVTIPSRETVPVKEEFVEQIKEEIIEKPIKEEVKEEKKFKTSEFISPIYGRSDQNVNKGISKQDISMDNIIDESFDDEDEFLNSLKGFRKNL